MKKILLILTILCALSSSVRAQDESPIEVHTTRNTTLEEALPKDSLRSSPLFNAFKGFGLKKSLEAYKLNRQIADSILLKEEGTASFPNRTWYRAKNLVRLSMRGPQTAMSLLSPVFLAILIIFMFPFFVKTFLMRPKLPAVVRPENDPNAGIETDSKEEEEEDDPEETDEETDEEDKGKS